MIISKLLSIQISPELETQVLTGHPWIFSRKILPFTKDIKNGKFISIENSKKKILGIGILSPNELVGLRIFTLGSNWKDIFTKLQERILLRLPLLSYTNSFRLIHGENDYYPGVTVDLHNDTIIIRYHSLFLYLPARMISFWIYNNLPKLFKNKIFIKNVILQRPNRISGNMKTKPNRILRGQIKDLKIHYRNIEFEINPTLQKGGIYNDIRNLRDYILNNSESLKGKRAMHLFSNNGLTSLCLEKIGYQEIDSLEDSGECLQIARKNLDSKKHNIIKIDIFKKLKYYLQDNNKIYDLVIIDPPSLTSFQKDIPKAKRIYTELIQSTLPYISQNGIFIFSSCSNRIHSNELERIIGEVSRTNSTKLKKIKKLNSEIDHPVLSTFPEGNYFKVIVYKKL